MRLNSSENSTMSEAIDKMSEGYNTIIEMYNESEQESEVFDEKAKAMIRKANNIYGENEVKRKINTIVKEMFEWIPLEQDDDEGD